MATFKSTYVVSHFQKKTLHYSLFGPMDLIVCLTNFLFTDIVIYLRKSLYILY